jgi:transposase
VAYAGFDPKVKQSGVSLHHNARLTKRGSPELRRVLFMAATVARRYDPELKDYYLRKREQGNAYTPAVIAVAQKMTNRIYAVLVRQTPYITKST